MMDCCDLCRRELGKDRNSLKVYVHLGDRYTGWHRTSFEICDPCLKEFNQWILQRQNTFYPDGNGEPVREDVIQ